MFQGLFNGRNLIKASIKAFKKHPILLTPLLVVWLIYAPIIIYLEWFFEWDNYSTIQTFWIVFFIIWGFAILLTLSCSILLELIQQKETGKLFDIRKSLKETLTKNIIQVIVLSFIWAVIWFFLNIIEAVFSKKRHRKIRTKEL